MAKYKITDPQSGKTVTISGDKPPTQADAEGIFQSAGLRTPVNAMEDKVAHYKNPILDFLARGYQQPGASNRIAPANGLERMLFPRGAAVQDQQVAGQPVTTDQRLGQVGEGFNRSLSPVVATNPLFVGGLGALEGATQAGASLMDRLKGGALQGGEQAATSEALNLAGKYLPKVLHPFKTAGEYREGQIADAAGKTISGDKLIDSLEEGASKVSPTMKPSYDRFMDIAKATYKGKDIPVDQATDILSNANTAYTAAGKIGKAATARFNSELADALRSQIYDVAPGVGQANQAFSNLYKAKSVAKKLVYPAATAGFFKLLGIGQGGQ